LDVNEVSKLDGYLKRLFDNRKIRLVPRAPKEDAADVHVGEEVVGELTVDDEDGDRSYNFRMEIPLGPAPAEDGQRLNAYLRAKLGSEKIRVMARARKSDSLEAYVGDEFVGVLFIDEDKNARLAILEMAILDVDLEQGSEAPPR
jgi:hypothetical protein